MMPVRLVGVTAGLGLALLLGGCSYDYLQHTDRVAYSAGDAVKANLEAETINPAKRSMASKWGLGRNGSVITTTATTTSSSSTTPASPGS